MIAKTEFLLAAATSRGARAAIAMIFCVGANGCASIKTMTADFNKKWDDPKTIIAEMDKTAPAARATDSSAEQMAAFNANDCARKFGLLDQAKADDGTRLTNQLAVGECLLDAGKNEQAANLFALISQDSPNAEALQGEGVALVRLARYDDGAAKLKSAVELDPALWRAWNALGVASDYQGLQDDAWAAFKKAAELNPHDGAPLNNLGVSLLKAGRHPEAVEALKAALAVEGAREAAEANLRLAYAMEGDYDGAVKALPDERRPVALNNAGVAAASRGDEADARRLFTRALDESPHFYAKAYNNLSLLLE